VKHSESFTQIAAALAVASGAFGEIKKDREVEVKTRAGGSYCFKYATLSAIVAAVRPALSTNGLVLVQSVVTEGGYDPASGAAVEEDFLETRLVHASGEWFANLTPVLIDADEKGAQAYGSAITYARRYGITQLLCVVADEDDDGNAASGNVSRDRRPASGGGGGGRGGAPASDKQISMLRAKLRGAKGDEVALCAALEIEALEALPKSRVDEAVQLIDSGSDRIMPSAVTGSAPADAAAKAACDKAVAANMQSLQYIRFHLGEVDQLADDIPETCDGEDPSPAKAALEWKAYSDDEKTALWLAPSKGGWFSTSEREAIRKALAALPKEG
jgi:hypothetical protein